jgi:hypothetical protein
MQEIWKPIPEFPGYEVSNLGRVGCWRPRNHRAKPPTERRILKPRPNGKSNYLMVSPRREGQTFQALVHRLVLRVFVGPCPEGMESLHGSNGRHDNSLENLRYGTKSENQRDRLRDGTDMRGTKAAGNILKEHHVHAIRKDARKYPAIAADYGVSRQTVGAIKRREIWAWLA